MKIEPKEVDPVFAAFPANVIGVYLPELVDIPEEFVRGWIRNGGACGVASALAHGSFFSGEPGDKAVDLSGGKIGFIPVDGIDPNLAWRHIRACLESYEPKHEHKIAGVGYLISMWFEAFVCDGKVLWENPDNVDEEE